MAATIITDAVSGHRCTFRSKATNDVRTWAGEIIAVGVQAALAADYTDIVAYNAAVVQADSTVNADPTALTYFIIRQENTDGTVSKQAFSEDWILNGSFAITDVKTLFTVNVFGADASKAQDIVTTLRLGGYQASIASITS